MALSKAITGHHTMWVRIEDARAIPVRYANTEEELVCFGDEALRDLSDGTVIHATVHEIACGPPLETFQATVRTLPADELSLSTVASVCGNAPDPAEGNPYEVLRTTRRFLALRPIPNSEHGTPTLTE